MLHFRQLQYGVHTRTHRHFAGKLPCIPIGLRGGTVLMKNKPSSATDMALLGISLVMVLLRWEVFCAAQPAPPRLEVHRPVGGMTFGWQDPIEFHCSVHGPHESGWVLTVRVDGGEVGAIELLDGAAVSDYTLVLPELDAADYALTLAWHRDDSPAAAGHSAEESCIAPIPFRVEGSVSRASGDADAAELPAAALPLAEASPSVEAEGPESQVSLAGVTRGDPGGVLNERIKNASDASFAAFFFPPPAHCFISQTDVAVAFAISEGYFSRFPERSWATLSINGHQALRWELSASMEAEPMSGYQLDISDGLNYYASLTDFDDGLYRAEMSLTLATSGEAIGPYAYTHTYAYTRIRIRICIRIHTRLMHIHRAGSHDVVYRRRSAGGRRGVVS